MTSTSQHTWLVTGAGSGIGAAVVAAATTAGDRVLALDIDTHNGEQVAQRTGATFQRCDVSDPEHWSDVVATLEEFGIPDRVHLNAGIQIAPPNAPLAEYQFDAMILERYRRMMGVNVDGVVFGLQALLPLLKPDCLSLIHI